MHDYDVKWIKFKHGRTEESDCRIAMRWGERGEVKSDEKWVSVDVDVLCA